MTTLRVATPLLLLLCLGASAVSSASTPLSPAPFSFRHGCAVTYGTYIYVIGGCSAAGDTTCPRGNILNVAAQYNVRTNTWLSMATMATPRFQHSCAEDAGRLFVVGGRGYNAQNQLVPLFSVEVYDTETDVWSTYPNMLEVPRSGLVTMTIQSEVYAFGGRTSDGSVLANGTMVMRRDDGGLDSMTVPRVRAGAAVIKNTAYVVGGASSTFAQPLSSMESLMLGNGVNDAWTLTADSGLARLDAAVAATPFELYVFGGAIQNPDLTTWRLFNDVQSYYPTRGEWTTYGTLSAPRAAMAAAACCSDDADPSHNMYLFGGIADWQQPPINLAEVYTVPVPPISGWKVAIAVILGLIVFGGGLGGLAYWFYRRRRGFTTLTASQSVPMKARA